MLLGQRGTAVHRSNDLNGVPAGATVVLAFPDDYSAAQLRSLAEGRRVVLPSSRFALGVLTPALSEQDSDSDDVTVAPGCSDAGAVAAGDVQFPAGTSVYSGANCYGGRAQLSENVLMIGPRTALTNAHLADRGVAALDINAITADGTVTDVTWLLPGPQAQGEGSPSIWDLFPGWTPRAAVWVLVLGVLVMIWRSRRMGPVVYEPLPVVVRAAELVEGHGRLYRRAHAQDRAAAALRQATRRRLARVTGVPFGQDLTALVAAVSRRTGQPPVLVHALLDGPPPADDTALRHLGQGLLELEASTSRSEGAPP